MRVPIQADLFLPEGGAYRRHHQVSLGLFRGAASADPERGPYLFGDRVLTATNPDGSKRFTAPLPDKARQVIELGPDRLVVQAGQELLSLDARTGQATGHWTSPYFLPDMYRGLEPDQVAVRQQGGIALLDRDLEPLAFVKVKGYYNSVRPLRKGGWLMASGSELRVLSAKGRMRAFSRDAIGSSAQEGPDGRVWFLETREGKCFLVRSDPTSAAKPERIALGNWAEALFPLPDGRFVTAEKGGRVFLHGPDGQRLGSMSLTRLDSITVSGDQLLAVTAEHAVYRARLDAPMKAQEVARRAEPVFACLGQDGEPVLFSASTPPEGEAPLPGRSWRERWGQPSWSTPEEALSLTRQWGLLPARDAAGIPGGTGSTWISPVLEGQPRPDEQQPVQAQPDEDWLFSSATQGMVHLNFPPDSRVPIELPLPDGRGSATLEPNHAVLNMPGLTWEGPYLQGTLETAIPLKLDGEPALLTACQGTVHLVGAGDNRFFQLGTPVTDVSVLPDRVVVQGTDGRLLVLHGDTAIEGPDELSARVPDQPGGGLADNDRAVLVGGTVLRKSSFH